MDDRTRRHRDRARRRAAAAWLMQQDGTTIVEDDTRRDPLHHARCVAPVPVPLRTGAAHGRIRRFQLSGRGAPVQPQASCGRVDPTVRCRRHPRSGGNPPGDGGTLRADPRHSTAAGQHAHVHPSRRARGGHRTTYRDDPHQRGRHPHRRRNRRRHSRLSAARPVAALRVPRRNPAVHDRTARRRRNRCEAGEAVRRDPRPRHTGRPTHATQPRPEHRGRIHDGQP